MNISLLYCLGALLLLAGSSALRQYKLGRYRHGFLGAPGKMRSLMEADVEDLWFEQKLDHFNADNKETWKQRYFVNPKYYRNDSAAPVFLMIGGEAEAAKKWMNEGAWMRYAEHFGALCLQLEHRFYGKSHPTSDLSLSNLQYLTSKQALADLVTFIAAMNEQYNVANTQKWILFGGSYPGSLTAWAREKYPEAIFGAISSSGPLLAEVDFKEYYQVVEASIGTYSTECVKVIERAFSQVEILLKHMIGQRNFDEKFQTCTPIKDSIDNQLDMKNLYESLASHFAGVVQYNKDNSPHAKVTIDEICDMMLNVTTGTPVQRLAEVNARMLKENNETCLDYKYSKMIEDMKETSWDSEAANGMRQWTYQTCNEFGFYQTSTNQSSLFGNRFGVDFFIKQCMDVFDDGMDGKYLERATSETNKWYGGLNPNTTNVLYVHGSIDPWHALGLISSRNKNLPTIYIDGTAHCANMYEPLHTDPPQLVAARNKIMKYLAKLISAYAPY